MGAADLRITPVACTSGLNCAIRAIRGRTDEAILLIDEMLSETEISAD